MNRAIGKPDRRVLITDGEERSALAACRALRSAGYEVDAVATRAPAAVHWSRSCSRRLRAPDPRTDRAGFIDSLGGFLAEWPYDVLLPGSDAALRAISEERDRLPDPVELGLPSHEVVVRCLSKAPLFEASDATELAAPRTEISSTLDEARQAAREIGFPVLVKPRMSARPEGAGFRERSSRRVDNESELAAATEDFGMPVLVQECLQGPVHSLGGVITDQGLVAAAYSCYRRTWPPEAGNVSCSETLPLPAELRANAGALLDRLGWRGIFELELMEGGDGGFAVIDLNPRIYGSLELAVRAGASLPAVWCDSLLERDVVHGQRDARTGVWYRWDDAEARYAFSRIRSGRIGEVPAMLVPHRRTAHAFFRLSDPAPLLARVIDAMLGRRRNRRRRAEGETKAPTEGSAA